MQQRRAKAQRTAVVPDERLHGGRERGAIAAPEHLTDHFNRLAHNPGDAERVRLDAIRERTAAILMQETGRLHGMADAWVDRPQLTCLVQDVWLKLENGGPWQSRAHFLGAVARAARQVLIDLARKRQRRHEHAPVGHHGGCDDRGQMTGELTGEEAQHLLNIERLLHELAAEGSHGCERAARVAGLRLFGGLSCAVIAQAEGVTTRTVERDWAYARAWITEALGREDNNPDADANRDADA